MLQSSQLSAVPKGKPLIVAAARCHTNTHQFTRLYDSADYAIGCHAICAFSLLFLTLQAC